MPWIHGILKAFDRRSHLQTELVWVLVGQALAFSGGFVGIKVLTSILGPAGFGKLALGITIAGLLHMFIYGPIEQVVLRFVSVCIERKEFGSFFSLIKTVHWSVGVLLLVAVVLATAVTAAIVGKDWAALVGVASLLGIASGINATFSSIQSALRGRKVVALHQGADVWLRLGLAVIALYLFTKTAVVALMGFLCGTCLVAISQRTFALQRDVIRNAWHGPEPGKWQHEPLKRELFDYGKPFILFALFGTVCAYADRWIILGFSGEEAVGGYAAIYQIANAPVAIFAGVTNQLMVPVIFERAGSFQTVAQASGSSRLLHQTVWLYGTALLGITAIAYVFGERLVTLITTPQFAPYHSFLWILTLGLALSNIGQLLVMKGLSRMKTQDYVIPKLLQTIAFLGLTFFLVVALGLPGVAWALCAAAMIYLLAVYVVNHRMRTRQ